MPQGVEDILSKAKETLAATERPKPPVAPVPLPAALKPAPTPPADHEFSKSSYALARPKAAKPKSEMERSLDWAAQQRKVAEQ